MKDDEVVWGEWLADGDDMQVFVDGEKHSRYVRVGSDEGAEHTAWFKVPLPKGWIGSTVTVEFRWNRDSWWCVAVPDG